jgi:hypothetical protein
VIESPCRVERRGTVRYSNQGLNQNEHSATPTERRSPACGPGTFHLAVDRWSSAFMRLTTAPKPPKGGTPTGHTTHRFADEMPPACVLNLPQAGLISCPPKPGRRRRDHPIPTAPQASSPWKQRPDRLPNRNHNHNHNRNHSSHPTNRLTGEPGDYDYEQDYDYESPGL